MGRNAPTPVMGPSLFDHLVGPTEQRDREGETKCPRGLKVDDRFHPDRLLDWCVARFRALQPTCHVSRLLLELHCSMGRPPLPAMKGSYFERALSRR